MKVIILAGGFGIRLSEYTENIPKPMVTIGGRPILWHIMSNYAKYGFNDFNLALGYKAEIIKEYFQMTQKQLFRRPQHEFETSNSIPRNNGL